MAETQQAEAAKSKRDLWADFIRYCEELNFGEIETLRIQNGVPVSGEVVTRKIKFN